MRTDRLTTIVRRVLLAESRAVGSAPRVKLLSEEGLDEELVAFVDSDIDPDPSALQRHQNFSLTSMTADDVADGRDPNAGAKSMEDQLAAKRRALRSPGFRKTAERMYGSGRLDLPILLIEATHLINNPVIHRFMLASPGDEELIAHKERGGRGSEHIQVAGTGRPYVTLRNQATDEAQSFLYNLATQEMQAAVNAYNEGRGARGDEMTISEEDVPNLVSRGVVSKGKDGLVLADNWNQNVVTVLLCNPSSSNTSITPAAFKALTFSRSHAAGEDRAPSFIRWDRTTPWLAVHRVIDALRSEAGTGPGKLNPISDLQTVGLARVKAALERTVVPSSTEYALMRSVPTWQKSPDGSREASVPTREVIAVTLGIPVGVRGEHIAPGAEISTLIPRSGHAAAAARFARSFRGVAGPMGDIQLIEEAIRHLASKTVMTIKVVTESDISPSSSVRNAAYGDLGDFLFTHAIQMGSARSYREKGVGLLSDDIIPECIVDSMYNRERGGLRINPDFLQQIRPMSGYIGSSPMLSVQGLPGPPMSVFTCIVSPTTFGNRHLRRQMVYTRDEEPIGGFENAIAEDVRAFLRACVTALRSAGSEHAAQVEQRIGSFNFGKQLIEGFAAPLANSAAQLVRRQETLFFPVKSKAGDRILLGAVRRNIRINRDDARSVEEVARAVQEFKQRIDAVANHLVTGEDIPGLSDRAAQQDLQLVGRIWVG